MKSFNPLTPKQTSKTSLSKTASASVLIQRDSKSFSGSKPLTSSFSFGLNKSTRSTTPKATEIRPAKNFREGEGFNNLPDTFKVAEKEEFCEEDTCIGCEVSFKGFLSATRHHCRVCAASVCDNCSIKRRLSKSDPDLYYCCNECDFKIVNNHYKSKTEYINTERDQLIDEITEFLIKTDSELVTLKDKEQVVADRVKATREEHA
jgi:hypothetical protein